MKHRASRRTFLRDFALAAASVLINYELMMRQDTPFTPDPWLARMFPPPRVWAGGNIVWYEGSRYIEVDGRNYLITRDPANDDIHVMLNANPLQTLRICMT